ncbi:phage integrase SAM-like domain-containing protein [Mucilaginibacter terrae]
MKRQSDMPIEQITIDFLERFEAFLRGPRIMTRLDRLGRPYKAKGKPLGDASVHVCLRDFSGLFSAAIDHHNRPSIGLTPIKDNPFSDYSIVGAPETKKRNIDAEKIITIKNSRPRPASRCEMARDLFMLSFYLCGMRVNIVAS